MQLTFIDSYRSEWIKRRRSLASWLVVIGAFFTPAVVVVARLAHASGLPKVYASDGFWMNHWSTSWESMAVFLLPMGVMLSVSLITQLEYKNNTWKQVHTTPMTYTTIYFSKLAVILTLVVAFFVLFNVGMVIAALVPPLVLGNVPFPGYPDVLFFLKGNAYYFLDCLPIVALQYLISLNYRNFLVPVGAGFLLWVGSIGVLRWKYSYIMPYSYTIFNFLGASERGKAIVPGFNFHLIAVAYFVVFTVVGYILYVNKKVKG
ncbi:ABC transporter permease [Fulvivirgaceae bacterium PWU5]|uniref:ABC transporter permease n=1 Tax=Dawidia cretensis TaxID=2782350 RepID=A0AAP2E0I5_9BACT|nr:ABC transporter permease [Dawidia cretensis]MBT1710746.1 ABC transporter permease [Dawidia cretensis]